MLHSIQESSIWGTWRRALLFPEDQILGHLSIGRYLSTLGETGFIRIGMFWAVICRTKLDLCTSRHQIRYVNQVNVCFAWIYSMNQNKWILTYSSVAHFSLNNWTLLWKKIFTNPLTTNILCKILIYHWTVLYWWVISKSFVNESYIASMLMAIKILKVRKIRIYILYPYYYILIFHIMYNIF